MPAANRMVRLPLVLLIPLALGADRPAHGGGIGLVLSGMPDIEKRLTRYPQFYSRIGFVHEFRPLAAAEIRQLREQRWMPPDVHLPQQPVEPETVATIIRISKSRRFKR
jgi:hypothetical protein